MSITSPNPYRFIPASGSTVQIPDSDGLLTQIFLTAPTAIASITMAWPVNPVDGQMILVQTTNAITALVHTGATLNVNVATMPAGSSFAFTYDAVNALYMISVTNPSSEVALPYATTVTATGNAFTYPTSDGTATGTALFKSISSVTAFMTVANPQIACGKPAVSVDRRTITINSKTLGFNGVTVLGISVLGSQTITDTANGVAVYGVITGVPA